MKLPATIFLLLLLFMPTLVAASAPTGQKPARPNILLIVADDMGYSDVGAFGGEIATPTLDGLANQGLRLSNFHVLPTCAPTRSVLLTGTDNHTAGLGAQILAPDHVDQPGYETHLNKRVATVAEVLGDAGYRTYLSGKWHLGIAPDQSPHARGFQHTFTLASGGASHFSDAFAIHPVEPVVYRRNGELVPELPENFYSSAYFTDSLLSMLEQDKNSDTPFFAYLAYTAPHDPLHAPRAYIDKYQGSYDAGYEQLRKQRHRGLIAQGILPPDAVLPEWPSIVKPWQVLSGEEQANSRRDMETYAAMIDFMDEQIGRVVQWLKQNQEFDNTLIVFLSDNGANAFPTSAYVQNGEDARYYEQFDNSLENRGSEGSFTVMGPGWATASSAGLRLFKAFSTEGGIRTPAIIKPVSPVNKGSVNTSFVHVSDLMPTFLELAKATHPATHNTNLAPMQGQSLVSLLATEQREPRPAPGVGYELHATQAYFKDNWKILKMPIPMGSGRWELFNLQEDRAELHDLALSEPDKLAELVADYEAYEKRVGVIVDIDPRLEIFTVVASILLAATTVVFAVLAFTLVRRKRPAASIIALGVLLGIAGLFTAYYQQAAWLLIVLGALSLAGVRNSRSIWIAVLVPTLGILLIAAYLFLLSSRLIGFMI